MRDATGADATAWARWIRGWSAEENLHVDVLNRYMYLSGRFDMREVERTVQRLIRDRMTVRALASPFHGFVYIAFQERATTVVHGNTACLVGARRRRGRRARADLWRIDMPAAFINDGHHRSSDFYTRFAADPLPATNDERTHQVRPPPSPPFLPCETERARKPLLHLLSVIVLDLTT
jgi:acyl-[acyl-carrier-protein] desaturase